MKLNIIKNRKIFVSLSAIFIAASLMAIFALGIRPGIDFTSGSSWQIHIPDTSESSVKEFFTTELGINDPIVSYDTQEDLYSITFGEVSDAKHQEYLQSVTTKFGEGVSDKEFGTVSPSVSNELKNKAVWVIVFTIVVIALFITFVFRKVSWPIKSYRYGIVTLFALAHDVIIAAGFFAILAYFKGLTADTNFIIALLTVAGFSVQDTIVVFDRIRENLSLSKNKGDFSEIVNNSVNEVIRRSINTTISIVLPLTAIAILGPLNVKYFALTILIGLFFGSYSSIFLASPLLVVWQGIDIKKKRL